MKKLLALAFALMLIFSVALADEPLTIAVSMRSTASEYHCSTLPAPSCLQPPCRKALLSCRRSPAKATMTSRSTTSMR